MRIDISILKAVTAAGAAAALASLRLPGTDVASSGGSMVHRMIFHLLILFPFKFVGQEKVCLPITVIFYEKKSKW